MPITHAKVSAKTDTADPTLVQASDWNDEHVGGGAFDYIQDTDPTLDGPVAENAIWLRLPVLRRYDVWGGGNDYEFEDEIEPDPSNGHFYKNVGTVGVSGVSQPTFPTNGSTVADGPDIIWQDEGLIGRVFGMQPRIFRMTDSDVWEGVGVSDFLSSAYVDGGEEANIRGYGVGGTTVSVIALTFNTIEILFENGTGIEANRGGEWTRIKTATSQLEVGADALNWSGGNVLLNLPTVDPAVAGALWNDGGTVKVSAG